MKKPRNIGKPGPTTFGNTKQEDAWLDSFVGKMAEANNAEVSFYEDRQKKGQGVGLDDAGKLVYPKKPETE